MAYETVVTSKRCGEIPNKGDGPLYHIQQRCVFDGIYCMQIFATECWSRRSVMQKEAKSAYLLKFVKVSGS